MPTFFINFSTWVQGVLFILMVYHVSSYFFTKDKSFAIYASYLFLVFVYLIPKTKNESSLYLLNNFEAFFSAINWIIQIFYWLLYTWFTLYFLSIENKNKKLANVLRWYIKITFVVTIMLFFIDYFLYNKAYFFWFYAFVFLPASLIIAGFFLRIVYQFNDRLNNFFIIGLIFFVGFSILSFAFSFPSRSIWGSFAPIDIFIFGVLIEAITLSIGLGYKFFLFREEHFKIEHLKSTFENQINELKLASLHSQMNPHFIFNALNSIKLYIINNDKNKAAYYLTKFSKLIRVILEASTKNEVSLKEELETINMYFNIENIRFNEQISFSLIIDDTLDLHQIFVPPLILQPFIENAIWHGLSTKKDNKEIRITIIKREVNFIEICIEDNGVGRQESAKIKAEKSISKKSIGIKLTQERLNGFVKNKNHNYTLTYKDLFSETNSVIGTKVLLQMPIV